MEEHQTVLEQLGKKLIEILTDKTNRSKGQTMFLLSLVDNNFNKLLQLEEILKNNHCFYCPGDKAEVDRWLALYGPHQISLLDLSYLKTKEYEKDNDKK